MTGDVYGVAGTNTGIINQNFIHQEILNQSPEYETLIGYISITREVIESRQAKGETDGALKAAAELEKLEQQLEQFKENVIRLYEIFTKIEIDTERLVQAKAFFDRGEFQKADAILSTERMAEDLNLLIEREQRLDQEKEEINKNRVQIGNEYLIKARLRATFYDRAHRFEESCAYFEESLRAARTPETVFEYALFLQEHNCLIQAKPLYTEALEIGRELAAENPHTCLPAVANTLNNLAILQKAQNEYGSAASSFSEALQIYRELAAENRRTYLPALAMTLNNLGNLQSDQKEYGSAASSYTEALQIRRDLAAENRRTYLPALAMTLNNLGTLQQAQNEYSSAASSFSAALQIYRDLAAENPRTYSPYVATTLLNFSIFYLQANPNKVRSVEMATEVIEILQTFGHIPQCQRDIEMAFRVLQANGVGEGGTT